MEVTYDVVVEVSDDNYDAAENYAGEMGITDLDELFKFLSRGWKVCPTNVSAAEALDALAFCERLSLDCLVRPHLPPAPLT